VFKFVKGGWSDAELEMARLARDSAAERGGE
jgi:hypothetical protein